MNATKQIHVRQTDLGWTVYEWGTTNILGWVRRAEAADPCYRPIPDSFWIIPGSGPGPGTSKPFGNIWTAAHALARMGARFAS